MIKPDDVSSPAGAPVCCEVSQSKCGKYNVDLERRERREGCGGNTILLLVLRLELGRNGSAVRRLSIGRHTFSLAEGMNCLDTYSR